MEFYVTALDAEKTIKHIVSIRLGSHNLEIETGRFNNVIRAQRICKLCNMNCVESEYHFFVHMSSIFITKSTVHTCIVANTR